MADFQKAVAYLLSNEGWHYEDPSTGEISNYGISLRWLQQIDKESTAETVRGLSQSAAEDLYRKYWWEETKINLIPSDPVATKLLDSAVNMGAATAIKIFQNTLNEPIENIEQHITIDGVIGPQVIAAVQEEMSQPTGVGPLLDAFAVNLIDHYKMIVFHNIALTKDLPAWERRAEKIPSLV